MGESLKYIEKLERLGWRKHPNKQILVNFDGTQYIEMDELVDNRVKGYDERGNLDEIVKNTTPEQREWWMKYMYSRPKLTDQGPIDTGQEELF
jgi:hypothetical protein